ncbi:MAG: glycosyltransferase family 39 protein [Desulforhabdus sp.]|jgi:4-amino-4-deoxy-L-arabinose transferase-like glycosyltransferase|nr:glycosyltransferase family 39 protein [Desulforhabdus sp.]
MGQNLSKALWNDSRVRAVIILAICLRMAVVGYLAFCPQGIFSKADSWDYHRLALNLLYHQTLSNDPQPARTDSDSQNRILPLEEGQPHPTPDHYRTPVYPALVALVYAFGGTSFYVVAVQSVLSVLLVWVIMLFAGTLLQPDLSWRAGLLAAVEPLSLIYSHELMSDTLFVLLMIGGAYLYLRTLTAADEGQSPLGWAALGGVLSGLAILTRPVGALFPLVLLMFAIVKGVFRTRRRILEQPLSAGPELGSQRAGPDFQIKGLVVFFLVIILLASSWVIRNRLIFNRFFLTTAFNYNILMTITSQMVANLRNPEGGISSWEMFKLLDEELKGEMVRQGLDPSAEVEKSLYFRDWSMEVIRKHPILFSRYLATGMITLYVPDVPGFFELLGMTREGTGAKRVLFDEGVRPALLQYFGKNWPIWLTTAMPLVVFDLTLFALVFWGIVSLWRKRDFYLLLFLVSAVVYWVLISAVGAVPRYRFPQMPFLITLAAAGWLDLVLRFRKKGR